MQKRIYYTAEYSPQLALQHQHNVCDPSSRNHSGPQNKFICMEDPPNLNTFSAFVFTIMLRIALCLWLFSTVICQNPLETGVHCSRSCHYEFAVLLHYLL